MKLRLFAGLALLAVTALAQSTYKVHYDGGTLALKSGTELKLTIVNGQIRLGAKDTVLIDGAAVSSMRFTQESGRTFVPSIPSLGGFGGLAGSAANSAGMGAISTLAHQPKRYISISWDPGSAVLKLGSDWRAVIAELEAVTGKSANVTK